MQKDVIEKISALMTAAFGLVAALAWNEAITSMFKEGGALYSLAAYGPWAYAILVTIIAVAATIYVGKLAQKAEKAVEKKK
jgi:hypothetical protein